jgi:hypothetical protein
VVGVYIEWWLFKAIQMKKTVERSPASVKAFIA